MSINLILKTIYLISYLLLWLGSYAIKVMTLKCLVNICYYNLESKLILSHSLIKTTKCYRELWVNTKYISSDYKR